MKVFFIHSKPQCTPFITLDTAKCEACWECISICSMGIIGKVEILRHRHARFIDPEHCTGCLLCAEACPSHALSVTEVTK